MKVALVLGDAACVYEDAEAALGMFTPAAVFATNNIGIYWPHVDHWCTLHVGPCHDWIGIVAAMNKRVADGRNRPKTWAHQEKAGVDHKTRDWSGSSGLLAVKVALEHGFDRIVVAGVPLTSCDAHFYSKHKSWDAAGHFQRGWRRNLNAIAPCVRSMSGWTKDLLGAPTEEWLNSGSG